MKIFISSIFVAISLFIFTNKAFSAHPLITDDTGTQGSGKIQLEINTEYRWDKEYGVKEKSFELATIFSYGITDNVDVIFGIPYEFVDSKDISTGIKDKIRGIGDASLELKWRFYEKDGFSIALKPGISMPTGDYDKGLSSGRIGYGGFLIFSKENKPVLLHLNLGYFRNESKDEQRRDIWHASLAGEYEIKENLKLVGNVGIETNPDLTVKTDPAFILVGFIYSVTDSFSFDLGYKYGLNKPETDSTFLAGITLKF
ncbi:MAG: transporter [Proteobacteria bacterium]|nr:transporter [Pseudomonadota bacterium]